MAISTSTYASIATPRVYVDNLLLARTLGMKFTPGNIITTSDSETIEDENFANKRALWDMDPSRYLNFTSPESDVTSIFAEMYTTPVDRDGMEAFLSLMHTSNYAGVLNHNLNNGGDASAKFKLYANENEVTSTTEIVGSFREDVAQDGYMLSKINLSCDNEQLHTIGFEIAPSDGYFSADYNYNIGTFTIGTYLDFPFAPDLDVTIGYDHDGVDTRRTIGGKDLTHVSFPGPPDWGELPPFTLSGGSDLSFKGAGVTGRRSWNVKFSYIDKTDMFNSTQSGSSAGTYFKSLFYGTGEPGFHQDLSIVGTYLSRTLGGKLKHIFQPDKTKAEFYMVKLDQGSTKIKQLSTGVYEINLKFVQVW